MEMQVVVLASLALCAVCQLWFWLLTAREQRSLWYGLSFLAMAATTLLALEVSLACAFPFDEHPLVRDVNLFLLVVFAAVLIAFPFALVLTLIVTGIRLIRREGPSPRNMLSLGLGVLMVAYVLVWPLLRGLLTGIPWAGKLLDFTFGFVAILLCVAAVAFTLYTVTGLVIQVPHPFRRYGYIVVLGAGLMPDGSVTPLLGRRVERGVQMLRRNPGAKLVMSGGRGADEPRPEGEAMRDYALTLGVPGSSILVEDGSRNTRENLSLSQGVIRDDLCLSSGQDASDSRSHGHHSRKNASSGRILLVTDDYHVFRALLIARQLGIAADGVGSHVRLYFSLNALVREWVAYVSLRRRMFTRLTLAILAVYVLWAAAVLAG